MTPEEVKVDLLKEALERCNSHKKQKEDVIRKAIYQLAVIKERIRIGNEIGPDSEIKELDQIDLLLQTGLV